MAISHKTAAEVRQLVLEWSFENGIPAAKVLRLLYDMAHIEGSRSFRHSLAKLVVLLEQDSDINPRGTVVRDSDDNLRVVK